MSSQQEKPIIYEFIKNNSKPKQNPRKTKLKNSID